MANKKADVVRMYLPPDTNCLLSCYDHCARSRNYVNVLVTSKHPRPQWLTMDQAVKHCTQGIGIWEWASNDQGCEPDLVMACCGDTPTLETLAAVTILWDNLPELKIRFINVVDLMKMESHDKHPHGMTDADYDSLFTKDKPIIFAHGYPRLIHELDCIVGTTRTYTFTAIRKKAPLPLPSTCGFRTRSTGSTWSSTLCSSCPSWATAALT